MWSATPSERDRDRLERTSKSFTLAASRDSRSKRTLAGHKKSVDGLAWNSTGTRLASVGRDAMVRVWTIDVKKELSTQNMECMELKGHTNDVEKCTWNPTNPDQLATCSADKSIKIWDGRHGKLLHSLTTIGENIHIKWSPDGRYLVCCNNNNLVSLVQFDSQTKKPQVIRSVGFAMDINAIEWEKNSERVIFGYQRGSLEVCSLPTLAVVASIPCHSTTIFNVQFDPRYKYLATGAADSVVNIWSTQDMVCVKSLGRLDDTIRALSFNHDSQLIAYGGKDFRIEISDVETGSRVHVIETQDETTALAFHPHANILAYAVNDRKTPGDIQLLSTVVPTPSKHTPSSHTTSSSSTKAATSINAGGGDSKSSTASSSTSNKSSTSSTATPPTLNHNRQTSTTSTASNDTSVPMQM